MVFSVGLDSSFMDNNYNGFNVCERKIGSNTVRRWYAYSSTQSGVENTITITSNGVQKSYPRMYAPTVMLFEGDGNADARLIDYIDAEYYWDDIKQQNSSSAKAWTDALKALFDQHAYAIYNPLTHSPAVDETVDKIVLEGVVSGSSGGYSDDPNAC